MNFSYHKKRNNTFQTDHDETRKLDNLIWKPHCIFSLQFIHFSFIFFIGNSINFFDTTMADDDWIDDDVTPSVTTFWTPPASSQSNSGGRRPPRPNNPSDKRLKFQVIKISLTIISLNNLDKIKSENI